MFRVLNFAAPKSLCCAGIEFYGVLSSQEANLPEQAASPAPLIPYSAMTASVSSIHPNYKKSGKECLTQKPQPKWPGTNFHTEDKGTQWWKVTLNATHRVTSIKVTNRLECETRLNGAQVYVGATLVHTQEKTAKGGSFTVSCDAVGSEIKVQITSGAVLHFSGFEAYGEVTEAVKAPEPVKGAEFLM